MEIEILVAGMMGLVLGYFLGRWIYKNSLEREFKDCVESCVSEKDGVRK